MTYEDYQKAAGIVRKYNERIKAITDECTAELSNEFGENFIPALPAKIEPIFNDKIENVKGYSIQSFYGISHDPLVIN